MRWLGMFSALGWFSSGLSDVMLQRWDWFATDVLGVVCSLVVTVVYWREVY